MKEIKLPDISRQFYDISCAYPSDKATNTFPVLVSTPGYKSGNRESGITKSITEANGYEKDLGAEYFLFNNFT